jgi:multicomponent Na+:H+ antiporter subunit D
MYYPNIAPALIILIGFISFIFPLRITKSILLLFFAFAIGNTFLLKSENLWLYDQLHELLQIKSLFPFSKHFTIIILIASFLAILFSIKEDKTNKRELSYGLLYIVTSLMTLFTQSFLHLFLYMEVMALSSAALIFISDHPESEPTGMRYLIVHLLSGGLILLGIIIMAAIHGHTEIDNMKLDLIDLPNHLILAKLFILTGLMINVAAPPFSAWVADAYPKVSNTSFLILSAITTKINIFILLTHFSGTNLLIYFGLFMSVYGMAYAIINNHASKALCYALVGKLGVMLIWIGQGGDNSSYATVILVISHILYNAIMIITHNVIAKNTQSFYLSSFGGLFKSLGVLSYAYILAALNLSSFPLTLSYLAKSNINDHTDLIQYFTIFSNILANIFALKMVYFIFFSNSLKQERVKVSLENKIAIVLASLLLIIIPFSVKAKIDSYQLLQQTISIIVSVMFFWVIKNKLRPVENQKETPDMDILYRCYLKRLVYFIYNLIDKILNYKINLLESGVNYFYHKFKPHIIQAYEEGLAIRLTGKNLLLVSIVILIAFLLS